MRANLESHLPAAAAAVGVVLGLWLRVSKLPGLLLFGDEYHSIPLSRADVPTILTSFDFLGSGIALPLLQKASAAAFGDGLIPLRLPALLAGALALPATWFVARGVIGRSAAAIATLALCASPIHVFYSHFGRAYALAALLGLGLFHAVDRVTGPERPARALYPLLSLAFALLLYVHLSAATLALAMALGGALRAIRLGRSRRLVGLGASFAAGAVLCLALYLPAWEPTLRFIGTHRGAGLLEIAPLALATVLAGSAGGGWLLLLGCPAAALLLIRARPEAGWLLAATALLPVCFLLLAHPVGGAYPQARYLIGAVPFLLMLLAAGLVLGVRAVVPATPSRRGVEIGLGAALALASQVFGPTGPLREDPAPFANTWLGLHHLAVFDAPFEAMPSFYPALAELPGSARIIEAPALRARDLLLYRNYFLTHRQQTWLGFTSEPPAGVEGPFVALRDERALRTSGADYLILHTDVADELRRYLSAVAELASERGEDPEGPLLEPLLKLRPAPKVPPRLTARLRAMLGRPVFDREGLLVWRLAPERSAAPRAGTG